MTPKELATGTVIGTFISAILLIMLDKPHTAVYTPLHTHWCFERHVKEPWEHEPLGRIEQEGVNHILVTLGKDAKPLHALNAYVHGFTMTKAEFHTSYKEVPCPPEWK